MKSRTLEVSGRSIRTCEAGAGDSILLISGLGDDHLVWRESFDLLAARHRVIAFDNRGIGGSSVGSESFTLTDMAGDALLVMDGLKVDAAHVVGSSMGGAIAQELALVAPRRTRSLALIGTWGRHDVLLERVLRHQDELARVIEDPRRLHEAICLWVYSGAAFADGTVEKLTEEVLAAAGPGESEEARTATVAAAIGHDPGERLATIDAPTLIAVGEEDRICPLRHSYELLRLIRGSRLEVLHGRGHQPFQEDAKEFVEMLEGFWAGCSDAQTHTY